MSFQLFASSAGSAASPAAAAKPAQKSKSLSKRRRTAVPAAVPAATASPSAEGSDEDDEDEDEDELSADEVDDSSASFEGLGLAPWIVKQCRSIGIIQPTLVQQNCIPAVLAGQDCCGYAKTGSGKTAAFALPMLQALSKDPFGIFGVVLTPTRELAIQIGEQFSALGKPIMLKVAVVIGGLDMMTQGLEISRRPHVIVATPGRLADHIASGDGVRLQRVRFLVIDEADRLLDNESFQPDLARIFDALPKTKQTMLFSATTIVKNAELLSTLLRQPVHSYEAKSDTATVTKLKQDYVLVPSHVRHCYFVKVIEALGLGGAPKEKHPKGHKGSKVAAAKAAVAAAKAAAATAKAAGSCIVFTSTCRSCEELALLLREFGVKCVSLHSQMSQSDRMASLAKFRSSYVRILIATDVAGRGLDIAPVQMVLNFNVPKATNDYIHRVGRTARAGRGGRAITLMSEHDVELIHAIEAKVGVTMTAFAELDEDDVLKRLAQVNVARRAVNLKLIEQNFGERKRKRKAKSSGAAANADASS